MMQLAVLGNPVKRSRSPLIHAAALQAAGIRGRYRRICVNETGMERAAAWVRAGRLSGANITMPHKRLAAQLSDELTPHAERIQSVNTWVSRDGLIEGHSTDGEGLLYAWRRNKLPESGPIVVLGAGGVAAAALAALDGRDLAISARDQLKAEALLDQLGQTVEIVPWGHPVEGATVVNATPIGMNGESLPDKVLDGSVGLLDMTYGSGPTPSEMLVRSMGHPVAPGIDILIGQAMASFRLWTGIEPDETAIRYENSRSG